MQSAEIEQIIDANFLLTIIGDSRVHGDEIIACALKAMRLIVDLTYYENVSQVNWLMKLDVFKVLTEQCNDKLKSTMTFVKIFTNF